jgi:stearoyl-CoA desaturase (Delta-9 desaturase)
VREAGKKVDISDLKADPILRFQRDYWAIIMPLLCFVLPTVIPPCCWGESWSNAWLVPACLRYALVLNITWCVNSVAHIWGHKPYDKAITPGQNIFVAIIALGEGESL